MSKITVTKQATLAQAKSLTEELRTKWGTMRTGWFDVGKLLEKAHETNVHHALGLNFDDWVTQWSNGDIGRTTARDILQTIKALSSLPDKTVREIPQMNALELARLPESKRLDERWIRKAKNTPTRDFKEMVQSVRAGKSTTAKEDVQEFRILKTPPLLKPTYDQITGFIDRISNHLGIDQQQTPAAPYTALGAFLEMVTDEQLEELREAFSKTPRRVA